MKQSDDSVSDQLVVGEAGSQENEDTESIEVTDIVAATIVMIAEGAILGWTLGLFGDDELLHHE